MMLRKPVLLIIAARAAADCSRHTHCGSCLSSDQDGCFWCYDNGGSCKRVEQSLSPFGACSASGISLDAMTCECRPDVYTSCESCAKASHPSCVWMSANATGSVSYSIVTPLGTTRGELPPFRLAQGRCWAGSGFGPAGTTANTTLRLGEWAVSAAVSVVPSEWYWAQCSVQEGWMALLVALPSLLLAAALARCCCLAKRRRAHGAALLVHAVPVEPVPPPVPVVHPQGPRNA